MHGLSTANRKLTGGEKREKKTWRKVKHRRSTTNKNPRAVLRRTHLVRVSSTGSEDQLTRSIHLWIRRYSRSKKFRSQTADALASRTIRRARRLLQHFGIETPVDFALVGWVTIGLERGDQSAQSRRQHDQMTSFLSGRVRVSVPAGTTYRRSGADGSVRST